MEDVGMEDIDSADLANEVAGNQDAIPVMPGFRQLAERQRATARERAAQMAAERADLVRDLAARRQAAGLSQTEVAAVMGTSQSAVARLEAGAGDVRATTLERYAAAIGSQLSWRSIT